MDLDEVRLYKFDKIAPLRAKVVESLYISTDTKNRLVDVILDETQSPKMVYSDEGAGNDSIYSLDSCKAKGVFTDIGLYRAGDVVQITPPFRSGRFEPMLVKYSKVVSGRAFFDAMSKYHLYFRDKENMIRVARTEAEAPLSNMRFPSEQDLIKLVNDAVNTTIVHYEVHQSRHGLQPNLELLLDTIPAIQR